jgi:hypothetical protein
MSYNFKTVELNRGGSEYSSSTGFDSGTSVIIDAIQVQIKWRNSILQVNKALSKGNQSASYNPAAAYTASGRTITLDAGNFDSAVAVGDFVLISSTDYIIRSKPAANQVVVHRDPPATGTLTVYKGIVTWVTDLKRIAETIQVSGFLVNDYIHHPTLASKKYVEEKVDDLMKIVGATSNTVGALNLILRQNNFLGGRYAWGDLMCTDLSFDDSMPSEPTKYVSNVQRINKLRVSLSLLRGTPKYG